MNTPSTLVSNDLHKGTETKAVPVNILLVDDRPENLISLESILESPERNIYKACSGQEALKMALEIEFALVLLDVQMPDMDGFEVARLLKENVRTRDIAILFVTAISKEEKFTMQGYQEGAVDYLHKPLDMHIMRAKVAVYEKLYRQRKDLEQMNDRLVKTNKQLDEFVYIVSHDLKAPLRGIASLASFLEDELGPQSSREALEMINMMKSRTGRMQQMIDGILHYSKLSNSCGEKEDVDCKELIMSIIDLVAPPDHIRFDIQDNLPVVRAERIKLHEVLQNLIINAIKYNNPEDGLVRISCVDKQSHWEFCVEDKGVGIKPEHQEKIFGLFQTLQPKDKCDSSGLGLTIVKKIVEQQEGKISISSEFGKGSAFSFTWAK